MAEDKKHKIDTAANKAMYIKQIEFQLAFLKDMPHDCFEDPEFYFYINSEHGQSMRIDWYKGSGGPQTPPPIGGGKGD